MNFIVNFKTHVFDEDSKKVVKSYTITMPFVPRVGELITLPPSIDKNNLTGIITEVSHKMENFKWVSTVRFSLP